MEAAKRRGVHVGRPRKLTAEQIKDARSKLSNGATSVVSLAEAYSVSPCTVRRAVKTRER